MARNLLILLAYPLPAGAAPLAPTTSNNTRKLPAGLNKAEMKGKTSPPGRVDFSSTKSLHFTIMLIKIDCLLLLKVASKHFIKTIQSKESHDNYGTVHFI